MRQSRGWHKHPADHIKWAVQPARPQVVIEMRRIETVAVAAEIDVITQPQRQHSGGPVRRHSRVHRLQHFRLRRIHNVANPLHAKPDLGRRVAQGLASRANTAEGNRQTNAIVGDEPAGLECTQALVKPGYDVTLAEARTELGDRVLKEGLLPDLSAGVRVRGYRELQLHQLANVEDYFDSLLDADAILEFGCPCVVMATGAL